jgi:ABC-type sugar transport system ATPase subunit
MGSGNVPAIEVTELAKSYGHVRALRGTTLNVQRGTITAIVGDNGAGKSTLIKCLSGFHAPDAGQIRINGAVVELTSPTAARHYGVETVYQDLALCNQLTVWQNMYIGREFVRSFGPIRLLDRARMKRSAQASLSEMLVNSPDVNQRVKNLSGGQRQAIAMARAVLWGSGIIILDEPTAALGAQETAQVEALIRGVAEKGNTVLLVSHDFDQVARLSSGVWVMRAGRDVGYLTGSDLSAERILSLVTVDVT